MATAPLNEDDGIREATPMSELSETNETNVTSTDELSSCQIPVLATEKKSRAWVDDVQCFWKRQVRATVSHDACRDHLGKSTVPSEQMQEKPRPSSLKKTLLAGVSCTRPMQCLSAKEITRPSPCLDLDLWNTVCLSVDIDPTFTELDSTRAYLPWLPPNISSALLPCRYHSPIVQASTHHNPGQDARLLYPGCPFGFCLYCGRHPCIWFGYLSLLEAAECYTAWEGACRWMGGKFYWACHLSSTVYILGGAVAF